MSVHLLRGVCFAAVLTAAALLPSVSAAQVLRTEPGEWLVGPINITSSSGLAFCSMKTRYANGQSLVVASDSKGAYSLAIDFGAKALTPGSQYYVTFYVGPIHRTMIAIAATNEVLISQMGDDRDFFGMMRARDVLEADFNNQRLSFALKGSAAALDELTACVGALGQGQAYAQSKISTPEKAAARVAEQKAVEREIARNDDLRLGHQAVSSSLGEEMRALQAENQRLRQENQAIAARLKQDEFAAAEAELAQMAELEQQERLLRLENARLKAEAETVSAVTAVLSPLSAMPPRLPSAPQPVPKRKPQAPVSAASAVTVRHVEPASIQPAVGVAMAAGQAHDAIEAEPVITTSGMPARILDWMSLSDLPADQTSGMPVWRWDTGDVVVALQAWPAQQGAVVAIDSYLDILKTRCDGDFARTLAGPVTTAQGVQLQTAEIACIGNAQQAAAGLVFISDGADLAVVTYEAATDMMGEALAQRAALISAASSQGQR